MEVQKIAPQGFVGIARLHIVTGDLLRAKIDIKFTWQRVHARKVHAHMYPAVSMPPAPHIAENAVIIQ